MRIQFDHLQPTPVGAEVIAEAVLEKIEGRRLKFTVSASDSGGLVAAGKITRVLVDVDRFMAKCCDDLTAAAVSASLTSGHARLLDRGYTSAGSVRTLTRYGTPLAKARSSAGPISAGELTVSPPPPSDRTTSS